MALTIEQQARHIFKRINRRADTSPYLELYEEGLDSGFIVEKKDIWMSSEHIPHTAPELEHLGIYTYNATGHLYGVEKPLLKRYIKQPLSFIESTESTFYAECLVQAIPHDYGDGSYHFTLTDALGEEIPFGLNNWFVDNVAGLVIFYDGLPEGYEYPLYISCYQYIEEDAFSNFVDVDGTNNMRDVYYPSDPQSVATKKYVDNQDGKIWDVLNKLTPEKPKDLEGAQLLADMYTATKAGTIQEFNLIKGQQPKIYVERPFHTGDEGVLKVYCDEELVGEALLTRADDSGKYNDLIIDKDEDPYAGEDQRQNFYRQLQVYYNPETALPNGKHSVRFTHSLTGNSLTKEFYVETPPKPVVQNATMTLSGSVITDYISGVPTLAVGSTVTSSFDVMNAIGDYYPKIIAKFQSSHLQSQDVIVEDILVTGQTVHCNVESTIRPNASSEYLEATIVGLNSAQQPSTATVVKLPYRVDTVSREYKRLTAGTGQFPIQFGNAFNRSENLLYNTELQLVNGSYRWPAGDYTNNLPIPGPDYTNVGTANDVRWVLFRLDDIELVKGLLLKFNNPINFTADPETNITQKLQVYIKVLGETQELSTGWIDCNNCYPGVGKPSKDGDAAMVVAQSTATIKRVTFGPQVRTGSVYVRVGITKDSNISFSNITITT